MISNLRDFDNFLFESSSVSLMDNIYLSIKQSIKVKLVMPNQTDINYLHVSIDSNLQYSINILSLSFSACTVALVGSHANISPKITI